MREFWQELQGQAQTLLHRSMDRHLKLAVTGLSGSGKTALITALVHQLTRVGFSSRLTNWPLLQRGQLVGVQRISQRNHHIPSFPFEAAMEALYADPPRWPEPTRTISEIRLELRFQPQTGLGRHFSRQPNSLFLDIVDYPGEWLLDLPLLEMSYAQWSEQVRGLLTQPALKAAAEPWLSLGARLKLDEPYADEALGPVVAAYTCWLHHCKSELGYSLIQPGRFVLPGEYAGAPMLQFVPWIWGPLADKAPSGSLQAMLVERFEYYKEHLVKGFYQEHFSTFDRQIVLVDCLQALHSGPDAMGDLQETLSQLMRSFHYGSSNWWRRLFAPRIDKLLFAATKADHITPDQHGHLQSLLRELVQGPYQLARFESIEIDCLPVAAIRASEYRQVLHEGKPLFALQGNNLAGEPVHLFPGEVPETWPEASFWQQQADSGFAFLQLQPPRLRRGETLPHLRLDQLLEFLLGDKLQ